MMRSFAAVALLSMAIVAQPAFAAEFTPLGDLPGGGIATVVYGLSGDGRVVVGQASGEDGDEPFRWDAREGLLSLGNLYGSVAYDASMDGSVIVGKASGAAFRWTSEKGFVGLGIQSSHAHAVSNDGSVIVGSFHDVFGQQRAYRWNEDTGVTDLGSLEGYTTLYAYGVSADGTVVIGNASDGERHEGFVWTEDGGFVGIGDLPGGEFGSAALAISADGTTVVGHSNTASGEAVRWTAETGLIQLDHFPRDWTGAGVWDVSGDGSVIVGNGYTADGNVAAVWDESDGWRSLPATLKDEYDLDLGGWRLTSAQAVSDDGLTIAGNGLNPDGDLEGWIVNLFTPSPYLAGDYNGNLWVEHGDLDLALLNWGLPAEPRPFGWTGDPPLGMIDQVELDRVLLSWGAVSRAGVAIPEPSAIAIAVIGALAAICVRSGVDWRRVAGPAGARLFE